MSADPAALSDFFIFLDKNQTVSIDAIETQARHLFPDASVENREGLFLLIEFQNSLPHYQQLVKNWRPPMAVSRPPSPPPLGPRQGAIENSSSEDDPFHWSAESFTRFGRTIVIGNDRERIKYLRVDPVRPK